MSYLKKSFWGIGWTASLRGISRLASIGRIAVLARILNPAQFGTFGIAALVLGFLEIVTETGINAVLLQQKDDYRDYVDTAWVVSFIRGFIISFLIIILAPVITEFFASPDSLSLLYLVACVPFIRGFINPACVRFIKELEFDREFAYRSVILGVEIGTSIIMAIVTRSAVSFVWGLIMSAFVEAAMSWVVITPRPKLNFEWARVKHVLNRGKWMTGFGIFDYIYTQGDNITIGRLLGDASLGIYRTAYNFSTLPVVEISQIYYTVMFPVFVQIRSDLQRLRRAAIQGAIVIGVIIIVIGMLVWSLADPLVRTVLGDQWLQAIPIVRILALAGLVRGLTYVFNPLFMALGRQKYGTAIIFTSAAGMVVSIVPFIQSFGVVGAAYAALFGSLAAIVPSAYLSWRILRK